MFKCKIYNSLKEIIQLSKEQNESKEFLLSIALFKPKEFVDIHFEPKKIKAIDKVKFKNANLNLFDEYNCHIDFKAMPQIPFNIKLEFKDVNNKKSKMNILDWEINQLFLKYNNNFKAMDKVKQKLTWMYKERDLYLILGTMRTKHGATKNPFTIIGLFYPPKDYSYTKSLFNF